MPLDRGQRLGPYEILDPIASGGMGAVYKARDTRLDRIVAIKVSADGFGERFYREAKTIASLNHPHICTLHDVGKEGDIEYLVMEYIDGKPLRGPMPAGEVIRLGTQIADALDAAHRKGITHRDLKPANILLTAGRVKVLDFGLAKIAEAPKSESDATMTQPLTGAGAILGTLPYMAPEQFEGKPADARTDLWALGLLLYEMAIGERAFTGKTQASLMASIMTGQPPALDRIGSPDMEWVIRRCLAKDPEDRWQSARDLREGLVRETKVKPPARYSRTWAWNLIGLLAGAILAVGAWMLKPAPETRFLNVSIAAPEGVTLATYGFDLSPDGRQIAFTATQSGVRKLWLRGLDSDLAKPLDGTDGAFAPFWAPDGQSVGFFAPGKLKRLDTSGGPPRVIANTAYGKGASWSQSGVILFSPRNGSPLYRVNASGGDPVAATAIDRASGEMEHGFPQFLPDGKQYIYHCRNSDPAKSGLMLGNLEEPAAASPHRRLLGSEGRGIFISRSGGDGSLLYVKDSILMAQGVRLSTGQLVGDPLATTATGLTAQSSMAGFVTISASASGLLAFQTGAAEHQLVWANREGAPLKTLGKASEYVNPRLSPDGQRLLVSQSDVNMGKLQLWLIDIVPLRSTRLTFGIRDYYPVWSNNGREFVFSSAASGQPNLYRKVLDDGLEPAPLGPPSASPQYTLDWSRNGEYVIYVSQESVSSNDLFVWPLRSGSKPFPYLQTPNAEMHGQFSPDSSGPPKWVAYTSDESGVDQVYVRAFQGGPASGAKLQVTTSGGRQPRWRGDGNEIFYLTPDNKMMAAPVTGTPKGLEFGTPVFLFNARLQIGAPLRHSYDVTRDGKNFVLVLEYENPSSNRIHVLVNWEAGLRR